MSSNINSLIIARTIRNTQTHTLEKVRSFILLEQAVRIEQLRLKICDAKI
jgi:hypothetical protein